MHMDILNMVLRFILFVVFPVLILAIIFYRITMKRKLGKLLLDLQSPTNIIDMVAAGAWGIAASIQFFSYIIDKSAKNPIFIIYACAAAVWLFRATIKSELRENGIQAKEGVWLWSDVEGYYVNKIGKPYIELKLKQGLMNRTKLYIGVGNENKTKDILDMYFSQQRY